MVGWLTWRRRSMAHPRCRTAGIRTLALLAAVTTLVLGSSRDADASPGCTALNGTTIGQLNGFGFTAGDVITISLAVHNSGQIYITNFTSNVNYVFAFSAGTYSYTVPADIPASEQVSAGTTHVANSLVVSCVAFTPPAPSTPGTPVDSTNVRSLQAGITKSVSATSATNTIGAIDGGIGIGFSDGGAPVIAGPAGGFINFAAEPLSSTASRAEEAFAALGYAGTSKAPPRTTRPEREWSAWADIRGTGWRADDTTGAGNNLNGSQINLTAGLGRKLSADTLVGVVLGYENFRYDVAALNGSLRGDGGTIGGYFARRFGGALQFDAALAWSRVNYHAISGTAAGSFTGDRWLASGGLTGMHRLGAFVVEPSAKLYILWEQQSAWTDSLGTAQDGRNFSAGRTALGAKIARPFAAFDGWTLSPSAGLYGDWRFSSDNALPTATQVANIGDGWSGRVTAGLSATASGGTMLLVNGEYGGLGANYKIWAGSARFVWPF